MPRRVPLPRRLTARAFTVIEGRDAGLSSERLRSADLTRPFYGVRVPAGPETASASASTSAAPSSAILPLCRSYAPLLTRRQFFSHTTAALLWNCPLPRRFDPPAPLHITSVAPTRAPRGRGVLGHQTSTPSVIGRYGFAVSTPGALFCELATLLALDDLVAVGDHLVLDPAILDPRDIRPYVRLDELRAVVQEFTGRGCRAATSAMLLVRVGAESRRETSLRLLLGRAGLPEPESNVVLHADDGTWLGRADLVYRRWKVIVEYDGDQHRTDVRQYEEDIARVERFARAGWIVVKVRSSGLDQGGPHTIARVSEALRIRGWRP